MPIGDAVTSGRYGCCEIEAENGTDKIYEVTAWNYSEQSADQSYASCETDGQRKRVDGDYDITGQVDVVYNSENSFREVIAVNQHVVLYLFKRKPSIGLTGIADIIPAKVLGISGGVTIEGGGPQRWQITWGLDTDEDDPAPLFDQTVAALSAGSA